MKNLLLLLGVLFTTLFASAQTPTDLFFSEYVEGSGNNKGVEIYNPTSQSIDLSNYWVARYSNGSSEYTGGGITHLSGILEPYKTFVLINGQTNSTSTSPACSPVLQALANQLDGDYPAPTYMNGNDAIALLKTPNGAPPTSTNTIAVDLIGEIGLGNAIASETGWSYVKDTTVSYNSNDVIVTGKVVNYIVKAKSADGSTFGPFWMSWTSDHTLIRKPTVVKGVVSNPTPFVVTLEWDTVPAVIDTAGHFVYKDIWTNLGSHKCVADPNYSASVSEKTATGTISIFPNPVVDKQFTVNSDLKIKSIQVYNIIGKEIHSEILASPRKETTVEIGPAETGVYIVKVIFSNNSGTVRKILVK
jgi:hypothetical protein